MKSAPPPAPGAPAGYVLGPNEGETLLRSNGKVVVKVDPTKGSRSMALGTQSLKPGAGIPLHKHDAADEVLRVEHGHAHAMLDGRLVDVEPGSIVYVPRGTWHGVESTGEPIELLWIVTPPGLEEYFRSVGSPAGAPLKQLTPEQVREIGQQHGTEFSRP